MKLYNTLTRKKEELTPIKGRTVRMYSCGPTVYHYAHIGNLRTYIFADVLHRAIEFSGYKVKRAMNITDVGHLTDDQDAGEDKLEKESHASGESVWDIAEKYTKAFFEDCASLNIRKPKYVVRATDTITEQIALITELEKKGFTYETDEAVYFNVSLFYDYGALTGQKLSEKEVGVREEVVADSAKRNPQDFALWFKRVGKHAQHTMHWPSPWGEGFPGWHIECSAIATKVLGQPFDIHTGAIDLIGTHHTNEIAQSEAAHNTPLARIWMHGEFVITDKEKMSKSTGTGLTLATLKEKDIDPFAYRYLVLTAHYRSPLHFSWESLTQAQQAYRNMVRLIAQLKEHTHKGKGDIDAYVRKFENALYDDLDTAQALATLWEVIKDTNLSSKKRLSFVKKVDEVFGLQLIDRAKQYIKEQKAIPKEIKHMSEERWHYKQQKDFEKADALRLILAEKGYIIEDQEDGYSLRIEKK